MKLPIVVDTKPVVMDVDPGKYSWCSCGLSKKHPFCDGAHKGTEFKSVKVEFSEKTTVYWCACKHTKTPPFCDGSHKQLAK
jgi:CDGSH-type Zn-finger protein